MTGRATGLPARRDVLVAGGLLALAGCLPRSDDASPPDPEVRLRRQIAHEMRALARRYDAVVQRHPQERSRLAPLAAEHEVHAVALLGPVPAPGPGAPSGQAPEPRPEPSVPADPATAVAALAAAERAASRRRARQAATASPGLARLLASVAGSNSAHALLLGEDRVR